MRFEWDPRKASSNIRKHGVGFPEACSVLADPFSITIEDAMRPDSDTRFVTMGASSEQRLLVVVHMDRGDRIRIISARQATFGERRTYEEGPTRGYRR